VTTNIDIVNYCAEFNSELPNTVIEQRNLNTVYVIVKCCALDLCIVYCHCVMNCELYMYLK